MIHTPLLQKQQNPATKQSNQTFGLCSSRKPVVLKFLYELFLQQPDQIGMNPKSVR